MRKQTCKYCRFYCAYYRKLSASFCSTLKGHCSKQNRLMKDNETCGNFVLNELKEKRNSMLLIYSLENTIASINQIAQILKEKEEADWDNDDI